MTMRRGWLLALLVPLAAVAYGPVPPAAAQGNLAVQGPAEPPGLDLTASPASAIAAIVHYNVQEGLVKVDKSGKLVPWLAERWYTTDSKNYTFFLRKGVHFHNGRALKAADVKFALDRAVNPETKHPYRAQYENIPDDRLNHVRQGVKPAKKPLAGKRVRLAVAHAMNKEEVLKGAMFGYGKILGSNVDPRNPY